MSRRVAFMLLAAAVCAGEAAAQPLSEVPETVYDTPPLRTPGQGFNDGALRLDLSLRYSTDYVFRGIEIVEPASGEDALNGQIEAGLKFDLGRLPDPFVSVLTNSAEGDDISNLQVIRPVVGLAWETEPFDLRLGHQTFTYPDRDDLNTNEVFVEMHFNDATLFGDEGRILGPYALVAYDYDSFEGTYIEVGLRREEQFGTTGLVAGVEAHVAYVNDYGGLFNADGRDGSESGFQHYQIGLFADYELNQLLNLSRRYGRWSLTGQLNYTDTIDDDLRADTQLWGGFGITLRY